MEMRPTNFCDLQLLFSFIYLFFLQGWARSISLGHYFIFSVVKYSIKNVKPAWIGEDEKIYILKGGSPINYNDETGDFR